MDETVTLLKQLTEARGAPGYETEVREILRGRLAPLGQISTDRVGSLICRLESQLKGPCIMLAAHMDEIAFMVKHITSEGFIRFLPLGGWIDQVLMGHRVIIHTRKGDVAGVIGMKPPHVLPLEQRKMLVGKEHMYIDIGASSKSEVLEAGVRIGDAIVPDAEFMELAVPDTYLAKAFDDRVGCALMVQAMQILHQSSTPNVVQGVGTVMEEVGVRGVSTSLDVVKPDVAIVLEADVAGDVPNIYPEETTLRIGQGPSLLLYDAYLIPNHRLIDLVIDTAEKMDIPLQMQALAGGATDGGAIHLHKVGVPTIVLGIPTRHIHSHGSILHRRDYEWTLRLVVGLVRRLDADVVAELINF